MKTMVRSLICTILFLLCLAAKAQPGKNDWIISGSLGFNKSAPYGKYDTYLKRTNAQFSPSFGTFVTKRINTGLILQLSYNNFDTKYYSLYSNGIPTETSVNKQVSFDYSIGGYISYYYPVNEKLFIVNTAIVSFGRSTYWISSESQKKLELTRPTGKSDVVSVTHMLSLEYYIKPTLGFSLGINLLNYRKAFYYVDENNSASNVSLFNPQLSVKLNLLLKYEN